MKRKYERKLRIREAGQGYLFMSPAMFVLLLFMIGPIFYAIFLAFHKVSALGPGKF